MSAQDESIFAKLKDYDPTTTRERCQAAEPYRTEPPPTALLRRGHTVSPPPLCPICRHEPCGSFASFALVWPAAFAYTAEAMHTPAEVRRGILSHEDGAAVAVQVQKFARAASLLQSMPIEQIGTVPPACRFLYEWGVQCVLLQRICDQLDL